MTDGPEPRDPRDAAAAPDPGDAPALDLPMPELSAVPAVPAALDPDGDDPPAPPTDPGDIALLGLVDRLAALLDRSELTELEVQVGGTGLVLRKPVAVAPVPPVSATGTPGAGTAAAGGDSAPVAPAAAPARPSVKAPLTGIWYGSPSPGTAPYVTVGGEIVAGQVVGLIEAMKLFNEIKSDLSGRVARIHAENGKLVKARQPLIEVDPS
jgi:acetyl-CoA carboxylase biotin carboxyl carrier protein